MLMVNRLASVETLLEKEVAKRVKRNPYEVRLRSASDKLIEKMKKIARRKNRRVEQDNDL